MQGKSSFTNKNQHAASSTNETGFTSRKISIQVSPQLIFLEEKPQFKFLEEIINMQQVLLKKTQYAPCFTNKNTTHNMFHEQKKIMVN